MELLLALVLGAVVGVTKAKKSNGSGLDQLHYGAIYGLAALLLALMLIIFLKRMGVY